MIMLVSKILRELDSVESAMQSIAVKFQQDRPDAEILNEAKGVYDRLQGLQDLVPPSQALNSAVSHASWLVKRVGEDLKSCSEGDVADLIQRDLPGIYESVYAWLERPPFLDAQLLKALSPLITINQLDSAVRKAFVLLKDRLVRKFGLDATKDGPDLVNLVFGAKSIYLTTMDASEKQAYRDFFSGLFGLMRNRYAHNDIHPDLAETDAVVGSVNLGMKLLEQIGETP